MYPLDAYLDRDLCWVQPKTLTRAYQLQADPSGAEIVVASLRFQSSLGSLATGQTTTGCWSLKRVGFFKPAVTVRPKGQDENVAVYQPRWTGMEGEIVTGRGTYTFKTANFWATRYEILSAGGELLIAYRSGCGGMGLRDLFKSEATVTVTEAGRADPLVNLLVVTGWYLVILNSEDAAAVVTTIAAAASPS